MTIYIVIQLADIELIGVSAYETIEEANEKFEAVCIEDSLLEVDKKEWSKFEVSDTMRLAGDDAGSVQLIKRHT